MFVFFWVAVIAAVVFLATAFFDDIDVADALNFVDDGGSGWFSLRAMLLFCIGFGAVGYLSLRGGASVLGASAAGVMFGMILYLVGVGLAMLIGEQDSTTGWRVEDLKGKTGVVVHEIQPAQSGIVKVTLPSVGTVYHEARSREEVLPAGEMVTVIETSGSSVWVRKS